MGERESAPMKAQEEVTAACREVIYGPVEPAMQVRTPGGVFRVRISANVTDDFGIVTGLRPVLGCAGRIVGMRSS